MLPKLKTVGQQLPIDDWTRRLTRTSSDEMAIQRGDRFDPEAASFFVWWVERYCCLYEGEHAGEPLILMSKANQPFWDIPRYFDWEDRNIRNLYLDRLDWHLSLYDSNEPLYGSTIFMFDFMAGKRFRLTTNVGFAGIAKAWCLSPKRLQVANPCRQCVVSDDERSGFEDHQNGVRAESKSGEYDAMIEQLEIPTDFQLENLVITMGDTLGDTRVFDHPVTR